MIQKAIHFRIQELVPKFLYHRFETETEKLWLIFDPRLIWTADKIRMRHGPMICNTWNQDGSIQYRGFRPFDLDVGAPLSQHKFGRALDLIPVNKTAEEVREDILAHPDLDEYKFIRCLETGISWLHFDVRNWIGPILLFKP